MYGKYVIDERTLTDIANAIRDKEGTTNAIATNDFSDRISNIRTSEDLDSELTTQHDILVAQETLVNDIMSTLETKVANAGGSLNIFCQTDEPDIKSGIWIPEEKSFDKVNIVDTFSMTIAAKDVTEDSTMPVSLREPGVCAVGNCVYIIGGTTGGVLNTIYKYDTSLKTYTVVGYLNSSVYGPAVVADGTDIYIFGGRSGSSGRSYAYKFDTTTNTLTTLANMPYNSGQHQATLIGRDIYMFGGMSGNVIASACKYNIDSGTYTVIASLPAARNGVAVTSLNNKVYLAGGYGSGGSDLLEYDPTTDTYTALPTLPITSYCGGMLTFANKILIVGGTNNDYPYEKIYVYDPVTQVYDVVSESGGRGRMDCALVEDSIYIPGGVTTSSGYSNTMGKITLLNPLPDLGDEDLLIIESKGSGSNIKLVEVGEVPVNVTVSSLLHFIADEGSITTLTSYYLGNGSEWIEI